MINYDLYIAKFSHNSFIKEIWCSEFINEIFSGTNRTRQCFWEWESSRRITWFIDFINKLLIDHLSFNIVWCVSCSYYVKKSFKSKLDFFHNHHQFLLRNIKYKKRNHKFIDRSFFMYHYRFFQVILKLLQLNKDYQ